jgi:hypothetical protein
MFNLPESEKGTFSSVAPEDPGAVKSKIKQHIFDYGNKTASVMTQSIMANRDIQNED